MGAFWNVRQGLAAGGQEAPAHGGGRALPGGAAGRTSSGGQEKNHDT
ncbi:hypothetical protein C8N36_10745 [Pelagimonas varians]|uniref:Uncharacterized protein n=1 Tax=Pelagimonas varians TaxID=696760 RepID=A0A238KFT3_9RHOB|nr:hypothetical protein C8N36_10745 [Pelagimonas varians]SMX40886.1 hypothetical protein PEV8663_02149 [Pelagimonas varians]